MPFLAAGRTEETFAASVSPLEEAEEVSEGEGTAGDTAMESAERVGLPKEEEVVKKWNIIF